MDSYYPFYWKCKNPKCKRPAHYYEDVGGCQHTFPGGLKCGHPLTKYANKDSPRGRAAIAARKAKLAAKKKGKK